MTMKLYRRITPCILLLSAVPLFAATQHLALRDETPTPMPATSEKYLTLSKASIGGPVDAHQLIVNAISNHYFGGDRKTHWTATDVDKSSFYCIIHVVRWKDAPASDNANDPVQKVDSQNWYVYNGSGAWAQDDFDKNKRIFGAKNIALLYIHLNRTTSYKVEYDIDVTSKTPANLVHLFDAASAFLSAKPEAATKAASPQNVFGITDANIAYVPSDLSVTGNFSMSPGDIQPVGDSEVFDNEGKYWWDVSVAVPISKMSQLQFSDTNNTVTAANVDKRTVFAALDLYPFKKDVKNPGFDLRPYGLVGLGVSSQPLHRILAAAGW